VLGALPPPVTGMTLLTEKVVQRIQQVQPITVTSWSSGDARKRLHTRALRLLRATRSFVQLVLHGRVRNARLFITANSEAGLIMTGLLVWAGRALGYNICLHHHSYLYIDRYDPKMAWIDRMMSADDMHLVHCEQMAQEFRARYSSKAVFEYLYPSIVSLPLGEPRQSVQKPLRLGHLGNLSIEKGLDILLETLRVLRQKGRDVRLCLAGPFNTGVAKRMVEEALQANGGLVEHVGAVYGDGKVDYFRSIDCFLLPSRTESWGIVLNESLAAGVPVIATDRGCVRTLLGSGAGIMIRDESQYVAEAVRQIESWIDSPDAYRTASRAAIQQAECLHRTATEQLEHLARRICAPVQNS
jgi:glycosyltransferase involved in cell wall biosynthesis